jgi:glycosyltransferase involved in cell wall biosynthesis
MLSIIIITKNEEAHIARCISSVKFADEIIVVDSGSSDKTVEIAESLGAKVIIREDWQGYGIQKQRALEACSHDWVLSLDADEFVASEKDANKIREAISRPYNDAYRFKIQMMFNHKILKHAGKDTKHIRLFKREKARFSNNIVHEKVCLTENAKLRNLGAVIVHESYSSWEEALFKLNHYSSLSAKASKTKTSTLKKALIASIWMFIKNYILKKWFLDGKTGLALAIYQAQGSWYRHLKMMTGA